MDITKHAVKTVMHTLNEHDRFALVTPTCLSSDFPFCFLRVKGRHACALTLAPLAPNS